MVGSTARVSVPAFSPPESMARCPGATGRTSFALAFGRTLSSLNLGTMASQITGVHPKAFTVFAEIQLSRHQGKSGASEGVLFVTLASGHIQNLHEIHREGTVEVVSLQSRCHDLMGVNSIEL